MKISLTDFGVNPSERSGGKPQAFPFPDWGPERASVTKKSLQKAHFFALSDDLLVPPILDALTAA